MDEEHASQQKDAINGENSEGKKDDPSNDDDEKTMHNLESIAAGMKDDEFPVVPKEMQRAVSEDEASELLQWLDKDEYVKFQSFLNEKYAEFRKSAPQSPDPESLIRARWCRDTYYIFLREYRTLFSEENTVVDLLTVELGNRKLPRETADRLLQLLEADQNVQHIDMKDFSKFVNESWSQHVNSLQKASQKVITRAPEKHKQSWLFNWCTKETENLVKLWRDFGTKSEECAFVPALSPMDMPTAKSRAWARALLDSLPSSLYTTVQKNTDETLKSMKEDLGNDVDFEKEALQDFYFQDMEKIIAANKTNDFRFVPKVPISVLPNITAKIDAETMIHNITRTQVKKFEELLEERAEKDLFWLKEKQDLQGVRELWMTQKYYEILKEVMSAIPTDADKEEKVDSEANSNHEKSDISMLETPRKKQKTTDTVSGRQEDDATMERMPLQIADIHLRKEEFPRGVKTLQACVLYGPNHLRHVNSRGKSNAASESTAVYTVLLGDRTAPCTFDAWRSLANSLCTTLNAKMQNTDDSDRVYIEIENFDISNENRNHHSPMKKIVSNTRTTFRILPDANSSNMQKNVEVNLDILQTDFTLLKSPSPFLISLMGVVGYVGTSWNSNSGNPMQKIRLQDGSGKAVTVLAFDRQVDHNAVIVGNRIMLYFLSATPSNIAGKPASLWAFNESHIVLVQRDCAVEAVREEIEIP